MIEVELPDGSIAEFPDGTPTETIKDVLQKKFGGQAPEANQPPKFEPMFPAFNAATEGSFAGVMGGFDDEIGAGLLSPIEAGKDWFAGKGFSIPNAYSRKQQELDALKAERRQAHPVASIGGELAGGLALGGGASRAGLTVAGKATSIPGAIGAGALEGAGYGALYGAGEAKPGERLQGAGTGAAIGGVTGGIVGGVGGALANRGRSAAAASAGSSSDDVAAASNRLYTASEQQGVRFNSQATTRLGQNLKLAAGEINDKLRPLTSGTVDDVDRMLRGEMTLKQIDEFRQGLGLDLKAAKGQDKTFLTRMKTMVDSFLDNAGPGDMTGGEAGVPLLKEARKLWAQSKKAETVEKILDIADVKTGQYTQSGFANAIKREMQTLYKAIAKGREQGWTKEEIALIRQMAKGGSSSTMVNLFAKFAPRGVVSIGAGQLVGSMVPGVGNIAMPLMGHVAGEAADRGAMQAAQALRTAAATGQAPAMVPRLPNRFAPLIPGSVAPSMGTGRSLVGPR